MTPGTRVRTPDGRTGTVIGLELTVNGPEICWVEVDQVSNVNRLELFKTEFLEVIE